MELFKLSNFFFSNPYSCYLGNLLKNNFLFMRKNAKQDIFKNLSQIFFKI
jgi:hypothetical protein